MSNYFKCFCVHLYDMYYNTVIMYQGLQRKVHNFPYYATQIACQFNQECYLIDNVTHELIGLEGSTINEDICRIVLMVDGYVTETSITGPGTDGDYYGAMQKEHAYITQQAIYSGYKKLHGMKTLDLCFSNRIYYTYGPYSMRRSDRSMVNMSEIDN